MHNKRIAIEEILGLATGQPNRQVRQKQIGVTMDGWHLYRVTMNEILSIIVSSRSSCPKGRGLHEELIGVRSHRLKALSACFFHGKH